MSNWKTEQEAFWAGEFGADYQKRNASSEKAALANRGFFARVLQRAGRIRTLMEYGTNIGINLMTLQEFLPDADLSGVELNAQAADQARQNLPGATIFTASLLDFAPPGSYDFVLIKGVLIHINPDELPRVYDLLYKSSKRYICIAEYYSTKPVTAEYRGHANRLFKRDFAGDMLERFKELELVDYGFFYRRDPYFPQDDLTWFLLEKHAVSEE